jgi:hypothetical protein
VTSLRAVDHPYGLTGRVVDVGSADVDAYVDGLISALDRAEHLERLSDSESAMLLVLA